MTDLMTDTAQGDAVSGEMAHSAIIRALNFQIEVIVGEASMTLDALENMKPGTVIPLEASLSDVVTLRLNGVDIARGELVSVDDRFAVKITQVTD